MSERQTMVFLRRLAARVALNDAYKDTAFLCVAIVLVVGIGGLLHGGERDGGLKAIVEAPFIGNVALIAWAFLLMADVSVIATWCRLEASVAQAAYQPFLQDYQIPPPARLDNGSIQGQIARFLPTFSRDVRDPVVRAAHTAHNARLLLLPLVMIAAWVTMLVWLPHGLLLATGWATLAWAGRILWPKSKS